MTVTTVVLREEGKGSTWMINETDSQDHPFIRFIYYDPAGLHDAIVEAVRWAKEHSKKREVTLRENEPWRKPTT